MSALSTTEPHLYNVVFVRRVLSALRKDRTSIESDLIGTLLSILAAAINKGLAIVRRVAENIATQMVEYHDLDVDDARLLSKRLGILFAIPSVELVARALPYPRVVTSNGTALTTRLQPYFSYGDDAGLARVVGASILHELRIETTADENTTFVCHVDGDDLVLLQRQISNALKDR